MRAVLRVVRRVLLVLVAIGAVAAAIVAVRGYALYRDVLAERPVEEAVEEARSAEGYVRVEELPDFYLRAVVAIEDHRFYEHPGFDVIAICRAAWHDLTTLSLEQGGSTITQQLAKNLFLTQEKDFSRKVAELLLALDLEARYEKDEILELYVNTSYFGDGRTGIGPAARGYLGKEPSQMTEGECALMAGLPNAPSALSADPALAWARAELVLAQMERYGLA
ncbi:transglycosylase domain-containing protein [Thermophilibacter sp. ET337]|uniref:biosynthetic peptidoglycan transglycosylase n=1 Tax=Thermophilibacter sp. ET337 TaxID=2973084 RepID=UPI0021AC945C|nr:biosynthetic peptidoglycan transglycosylase [Thermophilibacter sp. ET337]MCR8908756.1 transglycosylase domain-containing protein [Thermophilibacter sp. ET337]